MSSKESLMEDKGHSSAQWMHTDDILTALPQAEFQMELLHVWDYKHSQQI